ncbi:hypothetical protein [Spirosoma pollinicola]|uniref:Uncharacterized protein n=1 Tax=Spirosoma pollinicola TaxID=2057025 RepID=A0A2K8ZAP3_9BACT|nr:hypothetical protein [Spirosoma pollinicola]AUD06879.1 hypothetical protein CWM47_36575 [Spirosoma pollinicola]
MKTRPLHPLANEIRAIGRTINTDDLLDQDDLYDNNWSISANDLFGDFNFSDLDSYTDQDLAA